MDELKITFSTVLSLLGMNWSSWWNGHQIFGAHSLL